jgi:hypothetical protein
MSAHRRWSGKNLLITCSLLLFRIVWLALLVWFFVLALPAPKNDIAPWVVISAPIVFLVWLLGLVGGTRWIILQRREGE